MELIVSIRQTLRLKYGAAASQVDQALANLLAAQSAGGVQSALVYADDASSLAPYGVSPISAVTAAEIKRVIDELDQSLSHQPSPLDAVLLIGGDEILPFHRLPNPVADRQNDPDSDVLTDNPYGSTDQEALVVQRPVGRVPDAAEPTPAFLVNVLSHICALHGSPAQHNPSFGLSTSVWQAASRAVYGTVEGGQPLQLSPPVDQSSFVTSWIDDSRVCYFNLHGSETTDSWYGQDGQRYPVAFRPALMTGARLAGCIYFSEACYGANILGKASKAAISLTTIGGGAACFVGSTKIAYGPATPPATDADLLGELFLQNALIHEPLGRALVNAKQDFFRQSIASGIFDDTAQKTLLEFVLYGDPSLKV